MKILYVEDNDDNVYMLKNRLTRAGFTIVVATDGARGVAMATTESLTSFSWISRYLISTAKRQRDGSKPTPSPSIFQ